MCGLYVLAQFVHEIIHMGSTLSSSGLPQQCRCLSVQPLCLFIFKDLRYYYYYEIIHHLNVCIMVSGCMYMLVLLQVDVCARMSDFMSVLYVCTYFCVYMRVYLHGLTSMRIMLNVCGNITKCSCVHWILHICIIFFSASRLSRLLGSIAQLLSVV